MKKFLVLVFAVLALSGCAAYNLASLVDKYVIRPAVEDYQETKEKERKKERKKEREREREREKQIKFCGFDTCRVSCLNEFDECNKQAKASCKGGDFKVVNKLADTYGKGIKYDLFYSCKKPPKTAKKISD